jgi:iron complex transport system permease protein
VKPARNAILIAASLALLAALVACSFAFGNRVVDLGQIIDAFSGRVGTDDGVAEAAILARVPRTVLAILVGAALALAGASLQAVTRNPLADPGILGVSSGASLAVVCGIAFAGIVSPAAYIAFAIVGAGVAAAFVYAVGSLGPGGATPLKLALAGAATTAALSSLISAIVLPRVTVLDSFRFWHVLLVGAVIVVGCARGLNALALGDDTAASLGANVARTRLLAFAGAVVLAGTATAVAGPIAFLGLVVPHLCRLLIGSDHRWLLPACVTAGASLLLAADIVGRVIARPSEIAVGIITALIGAPVFIAIVRRQRVREL